jgi:hypothetical protein
MEFETRLIRIDPARGDRLKVSRREEDYFIVVATNAHAISESITTMTIRTISGLKKARFGQAFSRRFSGFDSVLEVPPVVWRWCLALGRVGCD